MDHQDVQQQQQQKDFFNTLFTSDVGAENVQRGNESHHRPTMYGSALPSPPTMPPSNSVIPNVPLDFELVTQLMGIQGQQSGSMNQGQYNPQLVLEQRLKLNQLQQLQLQNQILQQQVRRILSLIVHLFNELALSNGQSQLPPDMHLPPHHMSTAHDVRSAPANLVFNTTPPIPLPSPGELDLDLSPLSPWMDAYKPDSSQQRRSKRTASPHEEEQAKLARQRPSPSPRVHPASNSTKRVSRGTKSASSTPLIRSTRGGVRKNGSSGEAPGDTPSPVDLSMPPPGSSPPLTNMVVASTSPTSATGRGHNITPVTPASIMNLGGLGINSGLAPPAKNDAKGKSAGRGKDTATSVPSTKKGTGLSLSLKPILPAGNVYSSNTLASSSLPSPVLRKSSHKAAEQKRRDSLKTTFDNLRTLLPPIPLPTEEGFPDEPILPGAMPPRGPPRGNAEGPNRGISKLQLLRCGNEYIRLLKEKISRRDNEIALLRYEVQRLRGFISEDVWRDGAEDIDLERDVDQGELGPWRRGSSTYDGDDGDEDMAE
ncbi:hypothetical protein EDB83DRAFT_2219157 [Lactarius deliciosus]|nr:hypothetical protein EDB83DRAFT_2219157 [Lactarius deliciosus]